MAFAKLAQVNKEMKTVGVAGSDRGVGVTHLCITMAGLLKQHGYKVAILEANSNQSFQEIAENFEIAYNTIGFEYLGIDYYFNNPNTSVATIKAEGYDYLIIDNGPYAKCNQSIFTMATYNLIVASSRYWNFSTLVENVCNDTNPNWENYIYVFPFAKNSKSVQKDITESLNINQIYFTEYNENPFKDFEVPEINEILGLEDDVIISSQPKTLFGRPKKKEKIKRPETVSTPTIVEEPDYEDFERPAVGKVSIEDLRDISGVVANSEVSSKLIDVLANKEVEEASKKYTGDVAPVRFAQHVDDFTEETSPVVTPAPAPVPKPEPEPEPVVTIPKFTEKTEEIAKIAQHISRSERFDVIKNHPNSEFICRVIKRQSALSDSIKELNA